MRWRHGLIEWGGGLLATLVAVGCADIPAAPMPEEFPRLPAAASYGDVWVEGRFYTDYEDIFGADLLDHGIVPVAVRIFLRSAEGAKATPRIMVEDIQPQLYLADGTLLSLVPYDRIEIDRDVENRVTEESLDISVIKPEAESKEGFIFFALPPGQFQVRDSDTLLHLVEPLAQEVRVSDSLLALEYFTDDGARPIYVGLRKDRRAGQR